MRVATAERVLTTKGLIRSAKFGFDPAQSAHLMGILRSSLYTRKALAVLREYGSNAWDAHRMCGKADVPIHITLPTYEDPTFKCRDFGPGLSVEDVLFTFTQYGTSTKRGADPKCACRQQDEQGPDGESPLCPTCIEADRLADEAVGVLGIGSKSGFCLSDRFLVTSWYQGTKSLYTAVIDHTNIGDMDLIHEEDCPLDETGLEIQVPSPNNRISEFEREARDLFRYMRPQPQINTNLPKLPEGLTGGFINVVPYSDWVGVMGCVPYRIDLDQIQEKLSQEGLWVSLRRLGGGLYLPIGKVEFAANREELQYTDLTINALVESFRELLDEYMDDALRALETGTETDWTKRHKAHFLVSGLGLKLPPKYQDWAQGAAPFYAAENVALSKRAFSLTDKDGRQTTRIPVSSKTLLLLADPDNPRAKEGWQLHSKDVVAWPIHTHKLTRSEMKAQIEVLLAAAQLTGLPIVNLEDERQWYPSFRGNRHRSSNAKHQKATFLLTGTEDTAVFSNNWAVVDPPEDSHVYVIISHFRVVDNAFFYTQIKKDKRLAKAFNLDFPKIYGYKSTATKRIKDADIENGTPYHLWRKEFFKSLMTGEVRADIRDREWASIFADIPYKISHNFFRQLPEVVKELKETLGPNHIVVRYFARHLEGAAAVKKFTAKHREHLGTLKKMFPSRNKRNAPQCAFDRILAKYPMLTVGIKNHSDMGAFWAHLEIMKNYILIMDQGSTDSTSE